MPTADEELAQINEKLGKIQSSQYKKYADKIKTFLVNKSDSGTQKNHHNKTKNLTLKGGKPRKKPDALSQMPKPAGVEDTSEDEESRKIKIGHVRGDGNCFYRALYLSAKTHPDDLTREIYKIFTDKDVDEIDEDTFQKDIRIATADKIEANIYDEIYDRNIKDVKERTNINSEEGRAKLLTDSKSLFEHLRQDNSKFESWRNETPKEIKDKFTLMYFKQNYSKKEDSEKFYKDIADIIRKPGIYASETDIAVVKYILIKYDIHLHIISNMSNDILKEAEGKKILWLYKADSERGAEHYEYFKLSDKKVKMEHDKSIKAEELVEQYDVRQENQHIQIDSDCKELFDPCTREPIENSDINILERRVRDIKKQRLLDISDKQKFPNDILNRLDLLLFILNRDEKPNEKLLQYNINGQLYESYWDIVFALGKIDKFPITEDFYMFNGKIETLANIDGEGFSNNPLKYLLSKKVNEGSKSGASDITFVYKMNKTKTDIDECSSDPSIKVINPCRKWDSEKKESKITRPKFFFCSSKYFNSDNSKGVDKFDIQNIYTAAKLLDQEYDRKIILLVKDKGAVEEKLRKAIRKYISEEATYVYGMEDLFASLTSLYDYVHSKHNSREKLNTEMLNSILKLESPQKPTLGLRLHQYLAVYKISDAINKFRKTKTINKFLVGIVPRGGKTYIAGGIIDRLNPKRVVVLLGAKSETLTQFKNDLFEEFQNFNDYQCVDVVNTTDMAIDPSKKYIFIMSVELYKQNDSTRTLLQELKGGANRADLFICDEAHLKQTTARAVKQMEKGTVAVKDEEEEEVSEDAEESQLKELDKEIKTDVPVVYMTGTYIKPLKAFKIPDENVVIWDYQDIQQAKELSTNEEYFKENFGELYDRALKTCISYGQTYETIQQQYQKFPELYLLTTQFTQDAKSAFLEQSKGGVPTISHLFEVKTDFNPETTPPERWHTGFTNPKGMLRLLNYLAPPTQQLETIDGEAIDPISSVLKSVDNIAQRIGDRLGYFTSEFVVHSQLWFLPHMQGHPLYKRMCALAGAIFQSSWFRKYFHVIGVSSSVKWNIPGSEQDSILVKATAEDGTESCGTFSWACPKDGKSLKQCLLDQEAVARRKGKGLIILAQNMLHLGISLPCVDIVVLLDEGQKVDERIQKMYRALTESTNKKGAYIIDMNYFRTVTAIMNYQITAEETRKGNKKLYSGDIEKQFNKVLDIFYIDDDKNILRAEIVKDTLPELQKFVGTSKKSGDSIKLEDAGDALNSNVKNVLEKSYKGSYDEFLGSLKEEELKQKQLREEGKNVVQAIHEKESAKNNKESLNKEPKIFREQTTEKQKQEAYFDSIRTALKLGAFGTNSNDITTLEENLSTDEELRQTLYDTLIKRGAIQGVNVLSRNDIFLNKYDKALKNIKKYIKKILEYKKGIEMFKKTLRYKNSIFKEFSDEEKDKLIELAEKFLINIETMNEDELEIIESNINNDEEPLNNLSITSELNRFFTEIEYNKLTDEQRTEIEKEADFNKLQERRNIDFIIDIIIRPGLIKMIEENRNSSYRKMKESIQDEEKYPLHVEKVLDYIKEHLAPKSAERHKFGEVFTPMTLVNEMLDTLPYEVWNDKTLKWLDPANGMGNFPIGVFLRLFYGFRTKAGKYIGITNEGAGEAGVDYNPGLTKVITNEDLRRKHIVKDMLYMIELNFKNIAISRTLFKKLAPDVEANIIQMDRKEGFLADVQMKFPNGVVGEFDIVMGNPPYNSGSVKSVTTNETRKMRIELDVGQDKHKNLWVPFVRKSLYILKKGGYLLFIHPIGWFKPDEKTKTHELLLSNQIIQLRIYFKSQAKKLFEGRGEISIAYYLLKKEKPTRKTQIINIDSKKEEVLLDIKSLLCLKNNSIISKILSSNIELFGKSGSYQTKSIGEKDCKKGTNKQIHRIIDKTGCITFVKTDKLHEYQKIPKIILNGSQYPRYFFDKKGEYGLIGTHQHYFIGNDLDKIEDYFKTKLSAALLSSLKYDMDYLEPKYYPDIRTIPLEKITDETLADYFGFTKEERETIDATEYPEREYKFREITCNELKRKKAEPEHSDTEGGQRRFTRKIRRT